MSDMTFIGQFFDFPLLCDKLNNMLVEKKLNNLRKKIDVWLSLFWIIINKTIIIEVL
jgi:hypothetical protein